MSEHTDIVVRLTFEGFHRWPGAPDHRAYLRDSHRHLFHVEARVEVHHDDRELEFHDVQGFLREVLPHGDLGARSCEMLARELVNAITRRYGERRVRVGVFEDGEVGAEVTRWPV